MKNKKQKCGSYNWEYSSQTATLWTDYFTISLNGKRVYLHKKHSTTTHIQRAIRAQEHAKRVRDKFLEDTYLPLLTEASKAEYVPIPSTLEGERGVRTIRAYSVDAELSYTTKWLTEGSTSTGVTTDGMYFDFIESLEDINSQEHIGNQLHTADVRSTKNMTRCNICREIVIHLLKDIISSKFDKTQVEYYKHPQYMKITIPTDSEDRTFIFKLTFDYIHNYFIKSELVHDSNDSTEHLIL